MATKSIRIDEGLLNQVEREARLLDRTIRNQLEHWLKIGRIMASQLEITDIYAVSQGIKSIKLELVPGIVSSSVDSDSVFNDLERARGDGSLSDKVTKAKVYYEASVSRPGHLDRVDSSTGERQTGIFENGEFRQVR